MHRRQYEKSNYYRRGGKNEGKAPERFFSASSTIDDSDSDDEHYYSAPLAPPPPPKGAPPRPPPPLPLPPPPEETEEGNICYRECAKELYTSRKSFAKDTKNFVLGGVEWTGLDKHTMKVMGDITYELMLQPNLVIDDGLDYDNIVDTLKYGIHEDLHHKVGNMANLIIEYMNEFVRLTNLECLRNCDEKYYHKIWNNPQMRKQFDFQKGTRGWNAIKRAIDKIADEHKREKAYMNFYKATR